MNKREELEAEVRRIVSPQAHPLIIERPDGTELKLHIRAISFHDLETATDVVSQLVQGFMMASVKQKEMQAALNSADDLEKAEIFTSEVIDKLKSKMLAFLPWFIKVGTDIKFEDIENLDFLVTGEILIEIINFNFGERLKAFFEHASRVMEPLIRREKVARLADGLLPKQSSLAEDMMSKASSGGPSES